MTFSRRPAALLLPLALAAAACSDKPAAPAPAPAPPSAFAPTTVPENAYTSVLKPYEQARALLADDKVDGLAGAAQQMEAAAKQAATTADAAKKPHYDALAAAAAKLATQTDVEAARGAFSEVSKPLVALLAADPAAQKGLYVMECPMVKGFQKWVQLEEKLKNPYMGKKMLECGGPSTWAI